MKVNAQVLYFALTKVHGAQGRPCLNRWVTRDFVSWRTCFTEPGFRSSDRIPVCGAPAGWPGTSASSFEEHSGPTICRDPRPYMITEIDRAWRYLSLVPLLITELACGHYVIGVVFSAIATGDKVLGSASQEIRLLLRQPMFRAEIFRATRPYRDTTVPALAILILKFAGSDFGQTRHFRRSRFQKH